MFLIGIVLIPFFLALLGLLLPRLVRWGLIFSCLLTLGFGVALVAGKQTVSLQLMDSFGVSLLADATAAWFLLANAMVCLAVMWHERAKSDNDSFIFLLTFLHGCLNACFLSHDLFNLYVVIELTTIMAFLLIGNGMKTRHLWNALRYLFLSNFGMLFFLLGTLLVYEAAGDFKFTSVGLASPTAQALIVTGLLVKGGVCLPGLWLPQTHAESEASVSALLSGLVVNIALLPLLRLSVYAPELRPMIMGLGLASACLGLFLGFCQRDVKRLLACSTVSQVGFILLVPGAGAFYAFAHGVAKAGLFLCVSGWPDRDLLALREKRIGWPVSWPLSLAALSIAGCPLLAGFGAKQMVSKGLSGWIYWVMMLASVGTAALMMRLVLLPRKTEAWGLSTAWQAPLMLCSCILALGLFIGPYEGAAWGKAGATLMAGWLLHQLGLKQLMRVHLPQDWEKLEHVVGLTCLVLVILLVIGDFT